MMLVGCLGGAVFAQAPPATQPGVQQQTIEQEQRPTRPDLTPRPPAEIDKPASPETPPAPRGGPRVAVRKFRITGNTAIATDRLEALVRPDEGKELTLEQLRAVAAKVTEYYGEQGYILARAYLPPQDVREGTLEIAVLEGEIGEIEVIGYEYYSAQALLLPMTRFRNAKIVHEGLLETAINELNDYPGLNVRASLKPGEKRGLTDVVLTAQERFRLSGKLDADNYGSRFSGVWRYGGEFTYGGFTGYGDKFTFRGLASDETLNYFRGLYETPVGGYGTHLRFYYSYSENMVGDEFTALNAWSWFQVAGVEINQTILRTSGFNLFAFGGFDYKRVENDIQGDSAGKDDLRIFRLGFSGDYRDRLLGRTYFGMTWFQGVPALGGNSRNDPGATRPDNPGAFSKWTFDVARLQSLIYGGSYLVLRGFAQLSSQNLVAAEQYSIGGYYTVRGYPLSERSGDQGYSVSAELVVPVPYLREWLQAAAFVDHGGVFPISPDRGAGVREHFLSGVGGGLRLNLPAPYLPGGTFQLRLDYGYAVGPRPTSTTNRLLPATDRGILYVSTAIRF
jgi:hemolysin activation/secretion protein